MLVARYFGRLMIVVYRVAAGSESLILFVLPGVLIDQRAWYAIRVVTLSGSEQWPPVVWNVG